MTATATIQVAFVNPPQEGKRKGSIRAATGEYYEVWPNMIGLFRQGADYEIDFSERQYNGKTYRTIAKVRPQDRPQIIQGAANVAPEAAPRSIPIADAAELHFVTHVLAARISCCAIGGNHSDILNEVRALRNVFRQGFGGA